jgi:hypothetical protein
MTETEHALERAFQDTVRGHGIKSKNIPNLEITETGLRIGDHFDVEAYRESFTGDIKDIDRAVHDTYAPYWLYLAGIPEIEVSELDRDSPMRELDITVDISVDGNDVLLNTSYQQQLGCVVGDAVARRMQK